MQQQMMHQKMLGKEKNPNTINSLTKIGGEISNQGQGNTRDEVDFFPRAQSIEKKSHKIEINVIDNTQDSFNQRMGVRKQRSGSGKFSRNRSFDKKDVSQRQRESF